MTSEDSVKLEQTQMHAALLPPQWVSHPDVNKLWRLTQRHVLPTIAVRHTGYQGRPGRAFQCDTLTACVYSLMRSGCGHRWTVWPCLQGGRGAAAGVVAALLQARPEAHHRPDRPPRVTRKCTVPEQVKLTANGPPASLQMDLDADEGLRSAASQLLYALQVLDV